MPAVATLVIRMLSEMAKGNHRTREICSLPFTRPRSSQARSLKGQAVCWWSSMRLFDILKDITVNNRPGSRVWDARARHSPGPFRLICMLRSRAQRSSALCAAHRRLHSSCKRLRCLASLCISERSLYMLKAGSSHVHVAIRPHPAAVPGRRPDIPRIRARVCNRPVINENYYTSVREQFKGHHAAEYAMTCVLTLAVSLGILLCDARPSSARSSLTEGLIQQDVLYGELQLHYPRSCAQG